MNNSIIIDIDDLKSKLHALMDEMGMQAKNELEIDAGSDYAMIMDELNSAEYIVPVVGEAKLGKSSLLNGIIGSPILPVDLDVATSQALKVSVAEKPRYSIVYIDKSIVHIEKEDIVKISSQAVIDREGIETRLNKKEIKWVEIDYPTKFLPSSISLVDTPGLGALYSDHSKITNRILPLAKAVIFVLGSERPINTEEIKIIHKVISYTKDIVFVQTKIDVVSEWAKNRERNLEVIKREFKEVLPNPIEIWPVSNLFLGKAADVSENRSKKYIEKSRFLEMKFHLEYILLEKFGWDVIIAGVSFGDELVVKAEKSLAKSILSLSDTSGSESQRIINENKAKRRKLEDEWGKKGYKRTKHINSLAKYCRGVEVDFSQIFNERGDIYMKMKREIDQLSSSKEVKAYGEDMLGRVEYLFESSFLEFDSLLKKRLKKELEKIYSDQMFHQTNREADNIAQKIQSQVNAVVNSGRRSKGSSFSAKIGRILGNLFGWVFLPFLKLRKLLDNWGNSDTRLDKEKSQLTVNIRKVLETIRKEIGSTYYRGGRESSHQSQYFGTFPEELDRIIESKYEEKKFEIEAENKVHKRYLKNEIEKNKQEVLLIGRKKQKWKSFREKLGEIQADTAALRKRFKEHQYE